MIRYDNDGMVWQGILMKICDDNVEQGMIRLRTIYNYNTYCNFSADCHLGYNNIISPDNLITSPINGQYDDDDKIVDTDYHVFVTKL